MRPSAAARTLCAALPRPGQEPRALPARSTAADWDLLLSLAARERMLPVCGVLGTRIGAAAVDAGLEADLVQLWRLNAEHGQRVLAETADVATRLNRIGVEPVLLKGVAHLAAARYPDPALRVIGDCDLLVPEARLADCVAALRDAGYHQVPPVARDHPHSKHHPRLAHPQRAVPIELHRALADLPWRPLLPAARVLAQARPLHLGRARCAVPHPTHALVHAVVHDQLDDRGWWGQRMGLRAAYDFALLAADPDADAQAAGDAFDALGLGRVLHAFAAGVHWLFDAQAPASLPPRSLVALDQPLRTHLRQPLAWLGWYAQRLRVSPDFRRVAAGKLRDPRVHWRAARRAWTWVADMPGSLRGPA